MDKRIGWLKEIKVDDEVVATYPNGWTGNLYVKLRVQSITSTGRINCIGPKGAKWIFGYHGQILDGRASAYLIRKTPELLEQINIQTRKNRALRIIQDWNRDIATLDQLESIAQVIQNFVPSSK